LERLPIQHQRHIIGQFPHPWRDQPRLPEHRHARALDSEYAEPLRDAPTLPSTLAVSSQMLETTQSLMIRRSEKAARSHWAAPGEALRQIRRRAGKHARGADVS